MYPKSKYDSRRSQTRGGDGVFGRRPTDEQKHLTESIPALGNKSRSKTPIK